MRFLTAGESHGRQLMAIIEGLPSGLSIDIAQINADLKRRQSGYGRGRRMQIESDAVQIMSGMRHGSTTGAPLSLLIENRDWSHWEKIMAVEPTDDLEALSRRVSRPRPGHADLVGGIKYNHHDLRDILERSSARETAVRVAVGSLAKQLVAPFGLKTGSRVVEIGGVRDDTALPADTDELNQLVDQSPVRVLSKSAAEHMKQAIDLARQGGDSLGGIVEVMMTGTPVGLGSHVHYDRKLDARIALSVMSINAMKGVEFGIGFDMAHLPGSRVQDEISWSKRRGYTRLSNRLGGFEGGMTTGMPIIVRAVMKPIPTLYKPLASVDIDTKQPLAASIERADNCAVPAASIVCEAAVAWEVAVALSEKFAGDSMTDKLSAFAAYQERVSHF
ncbi:MAG: chorismate synthase [Sporolactobacillus sp.]